MPFMLKKPTAREDLQQGHKHTALSSSFKAAQSF